MESSLLFGIHLAIWSVARRGQTILLLLGETLLGDSCIIQARSNELGNCSKGAEKCALYSFII